MFKGFYNLTSGMLTQQRHLNVVGNNMVNVSTAGFKESRYTATTFDDVMYARVGNKEKVYTEIGRQSYIRANSAVYTNFEQGIPEPTNIPLDFAIVGDGFFAVRGEDGAVSYTRAGSFSLDEEGYLCFPGVGRVMDPDGQPILLETDKITADGQGYIYNENGGVMGRLGVYTFADNGALEHNDNGFFTGDGAQAAENPQLLWKYVERSNVELIRQMTDMITCQRALQSCASVTKMYDEVMSHAASDIGRM